MITWRRILHLGLFRLAEFLNRASHVCRSAAAGTLKMRELRDRIRHSWEDFRSGDFDVAEGLTNWEKETVERFFRPGERVLVVGSGSGRELLALTTMGYQAIGVEPATLASAIARRVLAARGHPCDVIDGFIEDVALPGAFDVIVFSSYAYGLIPESRRRIDVLRKVAAHLAHDGRIVISYWIRADRAMPARAVRAMAWMTRSDWHPEAGDVIDNSQYDHLFTPEEISSEAVSAGLQVVFHGKINDSPVLVVAGRRGEERPRI
jgi:SAM-dependent methyltransferase